MNGNLPAPNRLPMPIGNFTRIAIFMRLPFQCLIRVLCGPI